MHTVLTLGFVELNFSGIQEPEARKGEEQLPLRLHWELIYLLNNAGEKQISFWVVPHCAIIPSSGKIHNGLDVKFCIFSKSSKRKFLVNVCTTSFSVAWGELWLLDPSYPCQLHESWTSCLPQFTFIMHLPLLASSWLIKFFQWTYFAWKHFQVEWQVRLTDRHLPCSFNLFKPAFFEKCVFLAYSTSLYKEKYL